MARLNASSLSRWLSLSFSLGLGVGLASAPVVAHADKGAKAPAKGRDAKAAKATKDAKDAKADPKAAKPAPPKKVIPVSPEHKKALAELAGGFPFGKTKDEVLALLTKQVDDRFAEKIKGTSDVYAQDALRKEKKAELARIAETYVAFDGKKGGWDVSLVEDEFAHNTGESMLVYWENQAGKNQRRFFFFIDGKLYKMFLSLDTSVLPEDKKTFETFRAVMEQKYGPGDVEPGKITWRVDEFEARAIDKLKSYDALCLVITDATQIAAVEKIRVEKAPPKKETSSIIKSVLDTDGTDHPDVKANSHAVDDVIKAQGGGDGPAPAPKKKQK
jgi:hypothetical protein